MSTIAATMPAPSVGGELLGAAVAPPMQPPVVTTAGASPNNPDDERPEHTCRDWERRVRQKLGWLD